MGSQHDLLETIAASTKRIAAANEAAIELWKRVDERTAKALVPYDPSLMKKLDNLLKEIGERGIAAPPAESEAVQLLERWSQRYTPREERKEYALEVLLPATRALLAKLKGGA